MPLPERNTLTMGGGLNAVNLTMPGAVRDDASVTRKTASLMAAMAMLALVASPLVICAAEGMSETVEPMACCQVGHHDCGSAMKAADCCARSDLKPQQLAASKVEGSYRQVFVAVPSAHPASGHYYVSRTAAGRPVEPTFPIDSGPPHCVAFAVLLI